MIKRRRKRKRCIGLFMTIFLLLLQISPVLAEEEAIQNKVVRIACGMNDALYLNEDGAADGLCLPYLNQLAWNNNWKMEYVEGSYNESMQNLLDGKVDLMVPVGTDEDSEGKLGYSEFIGGYQQIGLFAKADADIFYEDYQGFDQKRVGISIGGNSKILDEFAEKHNFSYETVSLNSTQDKIDALMSGEVDLISFSTLNEVPGGKLVAVLDQLPFYFCTRAEDEELLQELNTGMSIAMVNTPEVVSDMYQKVLKGYNVISFTKEENEKILSTDKIVFGVYNDCLPLAGIDAQGNCIGIYVDIVKEIAKQSGLHIEIKPIEDSNRLYNYMDDGTVDFVIGINDLRYSSENADNYLMSNSIADITTVAVTMPEYQLDGEAAPVIALTRARNYLETFIRINFPEAEIEYYDNRRDCLNAVWSGTADATFLNAWEYSYETKNSRFQSLREWENIRVISGIALGATRQSDLELLSIFEKSISQIPTETMSNMIAGNANISYQDYTFADRMYERRDEIVIGSAVLLAILISLGIYLNVRRKYVKDLILANKTKSDFLSRMSHELRTPLNAINGYSSMTIQSAKTGGIGQEELVENMNSIQKASEYLLGIIKDILDVQGMETGKIVLEKSEIHLTEYMHTVVKMIQPMVEEKQIQFTCNMVGGEKYTYRLDGLRMQQVLFNILYNAVKFTPEGGSVTMTSEIEKKDDTIAELRFTVSDTGIGMSREFMETRLFQKFAQENQDLTSPYEGCGNGLAICKELVDLMEGQITCQSEQGKGTTFTITIQTEYKRQERRRRQRKEMPVYDLSGIRVLLCEDNPMNQDMTKKVLERMHCEVVIAENGKIGLELFRDSEPQHFSIILMDIRMPEMDGLEATRQIRALDRPDAKEIPIVAVSANAFEEDVRKSLEAGMNVHIAKPADGKILYEKIKQYCKKEEHL